MGKKHLLFVSYAPDDSSWAIDVLEQYLGLAPGQLLTERDFEPGHLKVDAIEEAIRESEYTLLLLSDAFFAHEWTKHVMQQVAHGTVASGQRRLLWIKIGDLTTTSIPAYLESRKGFDATKDRLGALEELRCFLQVPKRPLSLPPVPYMGMRPYTAENAHLFTARDREIHDLLRDIRNGHRYICVTGPSGSGKSSLIGAGLLPRLSSSPLLEGRTWKVIEMRPGKMPAMRLSSYLGGVAHDSMDKRINMFLTTGRRANHLLLWIDQLEELFDQADDKERDTFWNMVRAALVVPNCIVVTTIRSDYDQELMSSPLAPKEGDKKHYVFPLAGEHLRKALTKPAADCNVYLEPKLVDRILNDADAAHEPGVLPLVQETMVLLWDKMKGVGIGLEDYEALGTPGENGLAVTVGNKANGVYGRLTSQQQLIARRVFLRLVQFGEGRHDTRRQVSEDQLGAREFTNANVRSVLEILIENRLLTASEPLKSPETKNKQRLIDISHEVLIQSWPLLRTWINRMKDAEKIRRRLETRANAWANEGNRLGNLDKFELIETRRWLKTPEAAELGVSVALQELVDKSVKTNRLRTFVGLSVVVAVAILCGVLVAMSQKRDDLARSQKKLKISADATEALRLARIPGRSIDSLKVALRALEPLVRDESDLFAKKTLGEIPADVTNALVTSLTSAQRDINPLYMPFVPGIGTFVGFLSNEREPQQAQLIALSYQSVFEWNVATKRLVNLGNHEGVVACSAVLSDSTFMTVDAKTNLFTWHTGGGLVQFNAAHVEPRLQDPVDILQIPAIECAPTGSFVVVIDQGGVIHRIVPADTSRNLVIPAELADVTIKNLQLSDDGRWFVVNDGMTYRVLDLERDGRVVDTWPEPSGGENNNDDTKPSFLPGDKMVLPAAGGNTAILSLTHASNAVLAGHILAISKNGQVILTQSQNTLILSRMTIGASGDTWFESWRYVEAAIDGPISCKATFFADESHIVVACNDGFVSVHDAHTGAPRSRTAIDTLKGREALGLHIAMDPQGKRFATTDNGRIMLWDAASGVLLQDRTVVTGKSTVTPWINSIVFSPDGKHLAFGSSLGTFLWSPSATIARRIADANSLVYSMDLSRDGRRLVAGLENGQALVWDLESGKQIATLDASLDACQLKKLKNASITCGAKDLEKEYYHTHAVQFLAKADEVMTASDDGYVRRWRVVDKEILERTSDKESDEATTPVFRYHFSAAISADEKRLITTSIDPDFRGSSTRVWKRSGSNFDPNPSAILQPPSDEPWFAGQAIFSPNGTRFVTTPVVFETGVHIWDTKTGKRVGDLVPASDSDGFLQWASSTAYFPDGTKIAVAYQNGIARIFNASTQHELAQLKGHVGAVHSISVSHKGHLIVTSGADGTARVWDARNGELRMTFEGLDAGLRHALFAPDDRSILTAGEDGSIHQFSIDPEEHVTSICGLLNPYPLEEDLTRVCTLYQGANDNLSAAIAQGDRWEPGDAIRRLFPSWAAWAPLLSFVTLAVSIAVLCRRVARWFERRRASSSLQLGEVLATTRPYPMLPFVLSIGAFALHFRGPLNAVPVTVMAFWGTLAAFLVAGPVADCLTKNAIPLRHRFPMLLMIWDIPQAIIVGLVILEFEPQNSPMGFLVMLVGFRALREILFRFVSLLGFLEPLDTSAMAPWLAAERHPIYEIKSPIPYIYRSSSGLVVTSGALTEDGARAVYPAVLTPSDISNSVAALRSLLTPADFFGLVLMLVAVASTKPEGFWMGIPWLVLLLAFVMNRLHDAPKTDTNNRNSRHRPSRIYFTLTCVIALIPLVAALCEFVATNILKHERHIAFALAAVGGTRDGFLHLAKIKDANQHADEAELLRRSVTAEKNKGSIDPLDLAESYAKSHRCAQAAEVWFDILLNVNSRSDVEALTKRAQERDALARPPCRTLEAIKYVPKTD